MPTLSLTVPAEICLEHRGIRVYHGYRSDEYPERYRFQFSLSAEAPDEWQFDVRDLAGETEPDDPAALIRETLDRCLDNGVPFPYTHQPGPLPNQVENVAPTRLPDDWDLLDLLKALRYRTEPVAEPLNETHIAGVVQLLRVLAPLDAMRQATLEQWLREKRP